MTGLDEPLGAERSELLSRLDRLVAVRRMSKRERLRNFPLATLRNSFKMRLATLYSSWLGGYLTPTVDTVFRERMTLIVPPLGDIWIYGADIDTDPEVRLTRFLIRHLKAGEVFFDLGANLGYYSLLACKLAGAAGSVYAFEPSPFLLPLLKDNLRGKPNAHAVGKAISDSAGVARFFIAPLPYIGTSSLRPDWQQGTKPVEVETVSLDDYCRSQAMSPTFLKIDVEGIEDRVIAGSSGMLRKGSPVIALEVIFNPIQEAYRKALRLLQELGYRPLAIQDDGGLRPLEYGGIDAYLEELGRRYKLVHDAPNDFENLIFQRL
ncbi:MAG: FkbM family methyltransferase [Elusimicrobia bacterium]|nr:FkbM family methyltransferase [Elusimicrobiota bacterium]